MIAPSRGETVERLVGFTQIAILVRFGKIGCSERVRLD
jgi:hypothetical protein